MSTARLVPVIAPTGEVADLAENSDEYNKAIAAGAKPGVDMVAPTGEKAVVPRGVDYVKALSQGAKAVPFQSNQTLNADQPGMQPQPALGKMVDNFKAGYSMTPPGILSAGAGMVQSLIQKHLAQRQQANQVAVAQGQPMPNSPALNTAMGMAGDTAGMVSGATSPQAAAITTGAVVAPIPAAIGLVGYGGYQALKNSNALYNAATTGQANPQQVQEGLSGLATMAGGAALGKSGMPVPDNPNAVALRSMMGTDAAKDLFPAAETAVPELQTAAKQMGVNPDTFINRLKNRVSPSPQLVGRQGATVTEQVIQKAINNVEGEAQAVIQPVAGYNFDGPTAAAKLRASITPELREFAPTYAAQVEEQAVKLGNSRTIGEADNVRKVLNDISQKFYAKSDMAQSSDLQQTAAMAAAADELRGTLYDQVQQLTGQDLRSIRTRESSLMTVKGKLGSTLNKARGNYAVDQEQTALEGIRNAGNSTVKDLPSSLYKATVGKAIGQNPIERTNAQFGKVIKR